MMIMKKIFSFLFIFSLLFIPATFAIGPEDIGDWWGIAEINGIANEYGAVVEALINEQIVASDITGSPDAGYYLIHVPGQHGDMITFKLCGVIVEENVEWGSGNYKLNLSISGTTEGQTCNYYDSVNRKITVNAPGASLEISTKNNVSDMFVSITEKDMGDIMLGGSKEFIKGVDIVLNEGLIGFAIIKMYYTDDDISGIDESGLKLYHYNENSGEWEEIPDQGVNINENYIWANVTSFSVYALFGSALSPPSPPPGGGSSPPGGGGSYVCTPNWSCTEWSDCIEGEQTRTCTDTKNCNKLTGKPEETIECIVATAPTGTCVSGLFVCVGDELWECRDSNWVMTETCAYGCDDSTDGRAFCLNTTVGNESEDGIGDGPPTGFFLNPMSWFAIFIAIAVLFAIGVFWKMR